jgi:hypothetical protein
MADAVIKEWPVLELDFFLRQQFRGHRTAYIYIVLHAASGLRSHNLHKYVYYSYGIVAGTSKRQSVIVASINLTKCANRKDSKY